ncbi:pantoate--beta-alanine ligase [Maricaulis sp. D1M11]|uniref:pantoate--beta-alanine ligase n=1 Tax=Maricaulis sp. D1M11 TaxID=3076117 RepID=UPI0039B63284
MLNLQIPHATTLSALRARVRSWREDRMTIGFVPTMGALHEGHLALVRLAKAHCDKVVTSIFVNPEQFSPQEDLDTYPRTFIEDAQKLSAEKCDLIYAPETHEVYPDGFATRIQMGGPAEGLESVDRPHFFGGVATVVAKLLNQVRPDVAVFGEKDYQQLLVVRQLARDLDLGVDIIGGEIVREPDGLAMSSRNVYLSDEERGRAAELNVILAGLASEVSAGTPIEEAVSSARRAAQTTFDAVDYIAVRCARTLAPIDSATLDRPARVLGAVRLGVTRLIDNRAASAPRI